MEALQRLLAVLPEACKDTRLNATSVLGEGALSEKQRFAIALACAFAARNQDLVSALRAAGASVLDDAWTDDAKSAATLMAMNNVYYRFRHQIGKETYEQMPARLRMQKIASPRTSKADFELMCIAVSALNGCETCVRSHEHSLVELGVAEAAIHDAVRISAVMHAAAVALEIESGQVAPTT